MRAIDAQQLKNVASETAQEVFDTMLSMPVEPVGDVPEGFFNGDKIVGSVSFTGEAMGCSRIFVNSDFAREMTCAMLGMESEEIEGDEEVYDVIGEVSNMIGGGVKSHLCDMGFPCELSIPDITGGENFRIETREWSWHERCCFRYLDYIAMVEVFIKCK